MRGTKYTLKTVPSDFEVEEKLSLQPGQRGEYGIFCLTKEGLDTPSALKIVAARAGVSYNSIGCAGMKDRYCRSVQYISVRGAGEELSFCERRLSVEYAGRSDRAVSPGDHGGNVFRIILRRMDLRTVKELDRSVGTWAAIRFPNYFDSQRFGSLRASGAPGATGINIVSGSFALDLLRGDDETALRKILTSTYRKEKSRVKALKRALDIAWGNWKECARLARETPHENFGEVIGVLVNNPSDFRGALRTVRDRLLRFGAAALQDFVWNEVLKRELMDGLGFERLVAVRYGAGELFFPKNQESILRRYNELAVISREIPRAHPKMESGHFRELSDGLLRDLGTGLPELSRLADYGIELARNRRTAFFAANDLRLQDQSFDDTRALRRHRATLSFGLPPGSYATVVVKALLG